MGMFLRRGTAPHRTRMADLPIGGTIKLNLNGTPWQWRVVHQGLPSDIYDASCDGTWLLLNDIYESRVWSSANSNSYKASDIHSYLNSTFSGLFESNIQEAIRQVKIPYVNGTGNSAVASGTDGLLTKCFLLSGYEVGIGGASYVPADGAKLDYFNQNTGTDSRRIAYQNASATDWWLRSPNNASSTGNICDEVAPTAVLLASDPDGNLFLGQTLGPNCGDVML